MPAIEMAGKGRGWGIQEATPTSLWLMTRIQNSPRRFKDLLNRDISYAGMESRIVVPPIQDAAGPAADIRCDNLVAPPVAPGREFRRIGRTIERDSRRCHRCRQVQRAAVRPQDRPGARI